MNRFQSISIFLFSLVLFLASCSGGGYKRSTPAELGDATWLTLKNNDSKGYRALFVVEDDLDVMMDLMEKENPGSSDRFEEEFAEEMPKYNEMINVNFEQMRSKVTDLGLDWAKLEFKGTHVEEQREEEGFEVAKIKIVFSDGKEDYEFLAKDIANLDGKWVHGEPIRFQVVPW